MGTTAQFTARWQLGGAQRVRFSGLSCWRRTRTAEPGWILMWRAASTPICSRPPSARLHKWYEHDRRDCWWVDGLREAHSMAPGRMCPALVASRERQSHTQPDQHSSDQPLTPEREPPAAGEPAAQRAGNQHQAGFVEHIERSEEDAKDQKLRDHGAPPWVHKLWQESQEEQRDLSGAAGPENLLFYPPAAAKPPQVGRKERGSLEGFALQTSQPRNSYKY